VPTYLLDTNIVSYLADPSSPCTSPLPPSLGQATVATVGSPLSPWVTNPLESVGTQAHRC
jgi:hypothetical protein